jgi:hypothetical protein
VSPRGARSAAGGFVLAALVAALVLAVLGLRLPPMVSADAPAAVPSGARAMALLQRIAAAPRPNGSAELDRVRALLAAELAALGLPVAEDRGVFGRPLVNLTAGIAGSASSGTVLLLAHQDSVARGPGAGDDGVGLVAWLEALRALTARGWRPRNDVVLLLTDAEELGMLGAHHFVRRDPRAARVRAVVNLEAIGNGGPAYLFELGRDNGPRVRLFADAVPRPCGTSLAEALYHCLPNDTDLSVFLKRGAVGFNLALAWGSTAYHAPHDAPEHVDPRSVQHLVDCATALAERLGDADLAGLRGPDATFVDLFGRALLVWPRAADPWLAAAGLVLAAWLLFRSRQGWRACAGAVLGHVGGVLLVGAGVAAAAWTLDRVAALVLPPPAWVAGNTTSGALLFAGCIALGFATALPRSLASPDALRVRTLTAAGSWSAAALACTVWLPGAGFAWSLPALVVGLAEALPRRARESAAAAAAPFVLTLALGLPIVHAVTQLMLREPAVALVVATVAATSAARLLGRALAPLAADRRWRLGLWGVAAVALAGSVVIARWLEWRSGALFP